MFNLFASVLLASLYNVSIVNGIGIYDGTESLNYTGFPY